MVPRAPIPARVLVFRAHGVHLSPNVLHGDAPLHLGGRLIDIIDVQGVTVLLHGEIDGIHIHLWLVHALAHLGARRDQVLGRVKGPSDHWSKLWVLEVSLPLRLERLVQDLVHLFHAVCVTFH